VVDATTDALEMGLRQALNDRSRLEQWGAEWQRIVHERYQWPVLGERLEMLLAGLKR
jgi:hypothetical protein